MDRLNSLAVLQNHFPVSTSTTEIHNKLAPFFGPIDPSAIKQSPYVKRPVTSLDLPDVYKGENIYLKDTIEGFILEDNEWYTTVCLPWSVTDQMHVKWNEWNFNTVLADRVPHRGISRLITSSTKSGAAHTVRRGLAFHLEADFYNTPDGVLQYYRNVLGIASCVQETQNFDTIQALLDCKTYEMLWQEKFGRGAVSYRKIIEEEILNYACIVEDKDRLDILYETYKKIMRGQGVVPDMIIMPQGTRIYLTMVQPYAEDTKTTYVTVNDQGQLVQKPGPKSMGKYRGEVSIFETRDFDINPDKPAVQLMTRPVQVGEAYFMTNKAFKGDLNVRYNKKFMDKYIYNENTDDIEKIRFSNAITHGKIFNASGNDYHDELYKYLDYVKNRRDEYEFKVINKEKKTRSFAASIDDTDGQVVGDPDKKPIHFLFTEDVDGELTMARYFGHWGLHAASAEDFTQIASTIAARSLSCCFGSPTYEEYKSVWNDLVALLGQIQNQSYMRSYWKALIKANVARNTRNGKFFGERTPTDVLGAAKHTNALVEWKPNSVGSLTLPDKNKDHLADVTYPAGYDNYPGLYTLAQEADNRESGWYSVAVRAVNGLRVFVVLVNGSSSVFKKSEILKESNRSPNFHKADSLTTAFEHVFGQRDPVWLAYLPQAGQTGEMDESADTSSGPIKYLPGIPVQLRETGYVLLRPDASTGELGASAKDGLLYARKGNQYTIPVVLFTRGVSLPKIIKATSVLHGESLKSFDELLDILDDPQIYPPTGAHPNFKGKIFDFIINLPLFIEALAGSSNNNNSPNNIARLLAKNDNNSIPLVRAVISYVSTLVSRKYKADATTSPPHSTKGTYELLDMIVSADLKSPRTNNMKNVNKLITEALSNEALVDDKGIKNIEPHMPPAVRELTTAGGRYATGKSGLMKSYVAAAEAADAMLDTIDRITAIRRISNPNYEAKVSLLDPTEFADEKHTIDSKLVSEHDSLVDALKRQNTQLIQSLQAIDDAQTKEEKETLANWRRDLGRMLTTKGTTPSSTTQKTKVDDSDAAVAKAQFYRSPLTMSLTLLETLAAEELPLILPSDPRTAHLQPFRPAEEPGFNGDLPDDIYKRQQYASISELVKDPSLYDIKNATFISKHMTVSTLASSSSSSSPSSRRGNKGFAISDDEVMDFNDDDYERDKRHRGGFLDVGVFDDQDDEIFGNDGRDAMGYGRNKSSTSRKIGNKAKYDEDSDHDSFSGSSDKRRRSMKISARQRDEDIGFGGRFRDPEGGWTRDNLRKRNSGGDTRKPFYEHPTGEQSEAFKRLYNGAFVNRWKEANSISDPLLRASLMVLLTSPCDDGHLWIKMYDENVMPPVNAILLRIGIEHAMGSMILMKSGLETGANLYGNANFVVGSDVIQKMIYGNFTFYSKAFVWKSKNVIILDNVRPMQYLGGHNCEFVCSEKDLKSTSRNRPSIIAIIVPPCENKFPDIISASGYLPMSDINESIDGRQPLSYSTAEYYNRIYHFTRLAGQKVHGEQKYFDRSTGGNIVALQGLQFNYNESTDRFDVVTECRGHRKRNGSGRGAAVVWNGNQKYLPVQKWNEYILT